MVLRQKFYTFLFAFAVLCISLISIRSANQSPQQKFQHWAKTSGELFLKEVAHLQKVSLDFRNQNVPLDSLQSQILNTRLAYKKVEFLLEYYYPEFVEGHINGAPLFHIERETNQPEVIAPAGLQVLDELIFSEDANEERSEIANLAQDLLNNSQIVVGGLAQETFATHQVAEAMRLEIVRIFSMGVTGFDTPGSLNALSEAQAALAALQEASQIVFKQQANANQTAKTISDAIKYLQTNNDFDAFDRLTFLRDFINPLYADLQLMSKNMAVEPQLPSAVNPKSKGIFEADFLDPYFYAQLKKREDNAEVRALGKKIFFDKNLSGNQQMSCASCHNPQKGFADGQPKSASNVVGKTVERNSPTLLNAVYADRYFYDLRAFTLEQQAEHVIFNAAEFNTAYSEILEKIKADETYEAQFKKAFGNANFSQDRFSKALASYVLSLQSFNSPFDQYARGETNEIAPDVAAGFNLFMGKAACGTCHFAPTFAGLMPPRFSKNESEILGVLKSPNGWKKELDGDMGRFANELHSEKAWIYERSFKTSTVRNAALTAPYFHNGAYATLEEVMVFYNNGGGSGYGLDVKNQTLAADALKLTKTEQNQLIAFIKSLTDVSCADVNFN